MIIDKGLTSRIKKVYQLIRGSIKNPKRIGLKDVNKYCTKEGKLNCQKKTTKKEG